MTYGLTNCIHLLALHTDSLSLPLLPFRLLNVASQTSLQDLRDKATYALENQKISASAEVGLQSFLKDDVVQH